MNRTTAFHLARNRRAVHIWIRVIFREIVVRVARVPSALLPKMLRRGRPWGEGRLAPPLLRRRRGAARELVHPPLRCSRRLLSLRRRRREAPVGGRDDGAQPPHRRHVDPAGAHGGRGGGEGRGAVRARAGVRVPGEEERGGHDQLAGPTEEAEATPQDGGLEHHHPFRRGGRLTRLMQPTAAPCAAGENSSRDSAMLHKGLRVLTKRKKRRPRRATGGGDGAGLWGSEVGGGWRGKRWVRR
jgi:hypothetical protein